MKKHTLRPLVAALMLSPMAAGLAHAAPAGRVLMVIGEASAERAGQKIALKRGTLVEEGDRLITGPGASAQVMFTDQGLVALRENTVFKIDKFSFQQGADTANFKLEKGGVRTVTGQVGKANNKDYSLDAVVATIGIRGTNFELVLCEGQCAQSGDTAKNGLYGVVRGASGGTSRITINNDAGEKLLGKNDSFFVADKQSPAQQLVAPPSFVTARTESSKKSTEKSQDKPAEPTKEVDTKKTDPKADTAKPDGASAGNTGGGAQAPSAPTQGPTTAAPTTFSTNTAAPTTTLVPPPTNQSLLASAPLVTTSTVTPVIEGGSAQSTPGGTTVTDAAGGGSNTPPPSLSPTPSPTRSAAFALTRGSNVEFSSSAEHKTPVTTTFAGDGITPLGFSDEYTYTGTNNVPVTYLHNFVQGQQSAVTIDGSTSVNNLTEYVWGRWGGPAVTEGSGSTGNVTSSPLPDLATNLHFVVGPVLQQTPTSGYATYKLFGATTPTYSRMGLPTETGVLTRPDSDVSLLSALINDPLLAKVGFAFGTGLDPYIVVEPFRAQRSDLSESLYFSGEGSRPDAFKGIHLPGSVGNADKGHFYAYLNGLFYDDQGTLVFKPNYQASLSGQLMDTEAGGLGISYSVNLPAETNSAAGVVTGALVFRKDPATLQTPTYPSATTGALSLASFITTDLTGTPKVTSSTGGVHSLSIHTVNDALGAPNPTAFIASGGTLANYGTAIQAPNPIVREDNNVVPGYTWGRWVTPLVYGGGANSSFLAGGPIASVRDDAGNALTNLHFITGPELDQSTLPSSGFATYLLRGSTTVTGSQGKTGSMSLFDGSPAVGQLKADLGFLFSTDGTLPAYLRIESFKVTSLANSAETLIVAGRDSTLNLYRPIQLAPVGQQAPGLFEGSTQKIYKTTVSNPSLFQDSMASVSFSAQLMGSEAAGLGVSYSINSGSAPDGDAIGSLIFTRDGSALRNPSVTSAPGAAVASILSFSNAQPGTPPLAENFSVELTANHAGGITLLNNQPQGIQLPDSNGQTNVLANYSVSAASQNPHVQIDGTHVDVNNKTYYWGRWDGGNIVSSLGGVPRDQNPIAQVQFVTGPAVSNLPTSGFASYQIHVHTPVVGGATVYAATPPISTDGVTRQFQPATRNASPIPITAQVTFGPSDNSMTLSPFNLANAANAISPNPLNSLVITGQGSVFSGPSMVVAQNITFNQAAASTQQQGRFTSNNAAVFDGSGALKNGATTNLTGQLMGNGGEGLGIAYGVNFPRPGNTGIQDTVSGAFLLKKLITQ